MVNSEVGSYPTAAVRHVDSLEDVVSALCTMQDALETGFTLHKPAASFLEAVENAAAAETIPESAPAGVTPARGEAQGFTPQGEAAPMSSLPALERRALACTACALSAGRRHVVFGQGVPRPTVLVVGEGPGAEEDSQGLPFVGASGKLLDKMLASIGLFRDTNCYIANVVKCRPPNNREPSPDERASCLPFLREQIRLLAPRAILCAGRTAAQALLATTEGINRIRGKTYQYEGVPLIATYHPSALLRDETLKRPAWEDLKRLRALISDE